MSAEGYMVIALLLGAGILVGAKLFSRVRFEPAGFVRSNEIADERLRKAAIRAANEAQVGAMPREDAQAHIEELVRHAVGAEYASIYRGLEVEVTENWPAATCIITENIAVIEVWVGHTIDREGLRPVRAEIKRAAPLKLDSRRPIKDVLQDRYTPPAKDEPAEKPAPKRKAMMRGKP